ncbi:putative protein phosphatase 2C 34 [Apostasia shenzhenica]|uniref:protein-serine/threonine phosphatase n=1 Tax=Apostasia shenzhenica TaxID=1088818 RepID=A0A2I0AS80_9ASPA|nr:putative protein phosphatase 2C 34 [Apostasia shenzhenica]
MRQLTSFLNGWAKTLYSGKGRQPAAEEGREAADAMVREARKNSILKNSGTRWGEGSNCLVAACSQRGEKGVNQDCSIVWQKFGCQEDVIFCGVFDGHGSWGHHVARKVCKSLPSSLLCNWQEAIALAIVDDRISSGHFEIWKESFLRTFAAVDKELEGNPRLDSFNSGTTALSIILQGELMVIANIGDSRAVLATTDADRRLVPIQLSVDSKPNLPEEAERISRCNGRVFCLRDEPGVHRVWLPDEETPGLAMSRAFGDYSLKDFGIISVPEVSQWLITDRDHFVVLATDGVWDVISNKEAVEIVSSTKDRSKAARRLVECAARAWNRKRHGFAVDDCSAVCLFFHASKSSPSKA